MATTIGLDIGGAHLKVARVDDGELTSVRQIACPLWQGLAHLDSALSSAQLPHDATFAVTMTAELTEIFDSREQGVVAILDHLEKRLVGPTRVYMGLKGFASIHDATQNPSLVASANFLATAALVSRLASHALLIDIGSTTTDIIPCDRPQGLSDAERLQTGELVYTGYTRTPVPSVTTRAPLAGMWQTLARDSFASMADVRRVLGTLPDDVDQHATADGRGKTLEESLARLARGFGRDADMRQLPTWQVSATYIEECQMRSITDGALQVLSRPATRIERVVTAGIGLDVAARIANRLQFPVIEFSEVLAALDALKLWTSRCAPAVAIALLG
jgi:(4-(4-[2-(gamma-L-glutamylamino)ethyl]phenoxymethyl)furan-2-yl)methanamine synthase